MPKEPWRHLGNMEGASGRVEVKLIVDAGQEIRLDSRSNTLGAELFHVKVTPHPLDSRGELASTIDPIREVIPAFGRFAGVYRPVDNAIPLTFIAGVFTGTSIKVQAPYKNENGFRWVVKIIPQEQIHQNSAGYRLDIYGR